MPRLIEGTLSTEQTAEIHDHMTRCTACARGLKALQRDDKLLGDFVQATQPAISRVEKNVIKAISSGQSERPVSRPSIWQTVTMGRVAGFAVGAFLILLFFLLWVSIVTENRNAELETSPRYILGEAQSHHLKETRPWDILPPLPD
jgi:anti-sigma factor RsiW